MVNKKDIDDLKEWLIGNFSNQDHTFETKIDGLTVKYNELQTETKETREIDEKRLVTLDAKQSAVSDEVSKYKSAYKSAGLGRGKLKTIIINLEV